MLAALAAEAHARLVVSVVVVTVVYWHSVECAVAVANKTHFNILLKYEVKKEKRIRLLVAVVEVRHADAAQAVVLISQSMLYCR